MDGSTLCMTLVVNGCMSIVAGLFTHMALPKLRDMFLRAGLFGLDLCKPVVEGCQKPKIPEAQGVIAGAIYLIFMFLFIPVPFYKHIVYGEEHFPHHEFVDFLAALLSICCMVFLGFADDVLDLRWRDKLLLPTIASLPILMVYATNFNQTLIVTPKPFRELLGSSVDLGLFYYLYMGMMAVFCTNAINILAGVNGLEVGQSLVIAVSVIAFNFIQLFTGGGSQEAHSLSLYFLLPYVAVCIPLLRRNWCPAEIFVGDTFCYFSGMTFAVVAILGHFSKTMMLFFVPQVLNFLYSVPQLFHLVPCPRHRLPRINPASGRLEMSVSRFKQSELRPLGCLILEVFRLLRLVNVRRVQEKGNEYIECNNMTLINFVIKLCGPLYESHLTSILLSLQVLSSVLAFAVRYGLVRYFYDE